MSKNYISALLLSVILLSSCSTKEAAHTGQSVTTSEIQDGVTLTEADSRRILSSGKLAGDESALLKMEAVVYLIDYKTRKIGLKTSDNQTAELLVGPEVVNFNQIKAGDKVAVEYLISVAFEVRKPTEAEIELAAKNTKAVAASRAQTGDKPSAAVAAASLRIMNVDKVDKSAAKVILKDANSAEIVEVNAKYPENLNYIKAGDSVVITAAEAVAAKVYHIK